MTQPVPSKFLYYHCIYGYSSFLIAWKGETRTFGKPVVSVPGDPHYIRGDKSLLQPTSGDPNGNRATRLTNFTRAETFASPDVH